VRRVAGNDDDKVGLGSAGQLAHLGGAFRKALGEALEIVNELGALLLVEEGMVVFALLAAQLADAGNAQGDDGQRWIDLQRGKGFVRKGGAHVGQAGQAQVGLVGAELAHRVVVGDARERRGQRDAGGGKGRGEKLLDDAEDSAPGAGSSSPDRPA
jgi:hypothetical protein